MKEEIADVFRMVLENPERWTADSAEELAEMVMAIPQLKELRLAVLPFVYAGQVGMEVARAVKEAKLQEKGLTKLAFPETPAGVHAAESLISFSDWRRIAEISDWRRIAEIPYEDLRTSS